MEHIKIIFRLKFANFLLFIVFKLQSFISFLLKIVNKIGEIERYRRDDSLYDRYKKRK